MTTELEAAVRRLEAVAEGGVVDTGGDNSITLAGDVAIVLAALSSPPTDDVREVVREELTDQAITLLGFFRPYRTSPEQIDNLYRVLTALKHAEVRPRGPVTDAEVEASTESDAHRLADIRSWRANRHPLWPTDEVTMHIEDVDLLLRIADERDAILADRMPCGDSCVHGGTCSIVGPHEEHVSITGTGEEACRCPCN